MAGNTILLSIYFNYYLKYNLKAFKWTKTLVKCDSNLVLKRDRYFLFELDNFFQNTKYS